MIAAEILLERLTQPIYNFIPRTLLVGNTSTLILNSNPKRDYVLIVNQSDEIMYVNFGRPAQINVGVPIYPSGSSYAMHRFSGNLWLGEIYAITASGNKSVNIIEGEQV